MAMGQAIVTFSLLFNRDETSQFDTLYVINGRFVASVPASVWSRRLSLCLIC